MAEGRYVAGVQSSVDSGELETAAQGTSDRHGADSVLPSVNSVAVLKFSKELLRLQAAESICSRLDVAALASLHVAVIGFDASSGSASSPSVDVVLLDLDALSADRQIELIEQHRRLQLCVTVLTRRPPGEALFYLQHGADALISADGSSRQIAWALWSAYAQMLLRQQSEHHARMLEAKLEQSKLIARAKSILAEQLGISEAEALKQLRFESRTRRRPMHELAKVLIEAQQIMAFRQPLRMRTIDAGRRQA